MLAEEERRMNIKSGFWNWFQHPGDERGEGGAAFTQVQMRKDAARGVSCTRASSTHLSSSPKLGPKL